MLYTENLENLIFHRHEIHDTDELVILSGYLGPKPLEKLKELPLRTTVIYGMYGSEGIFKIIRIKLRTFIILSYQSILNAMFGKEIKR